MSNHELWHVVLLASTLFGAAGVAILALAPLVFGETPRGLRRARPLILGAVVLASLIVAVEWFVVHRRSV